MRDHEFYRFTYVLEGMSGGGEGRGEKKEG